MGKLSLFVIGWMFKYIHYDLLWVTDVSRLCQRSADHSGQIYCPHELCAPSQINLV